MEDIQFLRSCGILPADDPFITDPRGYALDLVENGQVSAAHLLLCALKYMSHDEVRRMLDANELSPRFEGADE